MPFGDCAYDDHDANKVQRHREAPCEASPCAAPCRPRGLARACFARRLPQPQRQSYAQLARAAPLRLVGCLQRSGCTHRAAERPGVPPAASAGCQDTEAAPNGAIQPCRRRVGPPLAAQPPSGGLLHLPTRSRAASAALAGLASQSLLRLCPASAPLARQLKTKGWKKGMEHNRGWRHGAAHARNSRNTWGGWDAN